MRSAVFFLGADELRSCAPESAAFLFTDFVVFSAELHYTNCVPDFC